MLSRAAKVRVQLIRGRSSNESEENKQGRKQYIKSLKSSQNMLSWEFSFRRWHLMQKGERLWKQIKQDKIFSGSSARKMILAGKCCIDWGGQCSLKGRYFWGNREETTADCYRNKEKNQWSLRILCWKKPAVHWKWEIARDWMGTN